MFEIACGLLLMYWPIPLLLLVMAGFAVADSMEDEAYIKAHENDPVDWIPPPGRR